MNLLEAYGRVFSLFSPVVCCRSHGESVYYEVRPKFLRCRNELSVTGESASYQTYCSATSSEDPQWDRAELTTPWTWENLIIQFQSDSVGASKFWLQVRGEGCFVFGV